MAASVVGYKPNLVGGSSYIIPQQRQIRATRSQDRLLAKRQANVPKARRFHIKDVILA